MPIQLNQFGQTAAEGMVDLQIRSIVQARVAATQPAPVVAGKVVKLVDNGSELPEVLEVTAGTDVPFGVTAYSVKNGQYKANDIADIAMKNSIIYLVAGGAIARQATVYYNPTTKKVVTTPTNNIRLGWAFDKATADGNLIRVYLEAPVQA